MTTTGKTGKDLANVVEDVIRETTLQTAVTGFKSMPLVRIKVYAETKQSISAGRRTVEAIAAEVKIVARFA